MGYHFARSHKEPKTGAEKLEAARQYFVVALIGTLATLASFGWIYWQQQKQAELSRAQAESAKANAELFRDLARAQGRNAPVNNAPQPPPAKSYLSSRLLLLPVLFGAVSLLMFYLGISYQREAQRMIEPLG